MMNGSPAKVCPWECGAAAARAKPATDERKSAAGDRVAPPAAAPYSSFTPVNAPFSIVNSGI